MAKRQVTFMLNRELIDYINNDVEGNSLSARINTAIQGYKTFKEENKSTGITQDLLTLTNIVQRITEYINKVSTKPVTNTNTEPEHVTTKVEEKKVEKGKDTFNDEDFDFELSEEDLK